MNLSRRLFLAACAAPALAAEAGFNGRWDITVDGRGRGRVWWLEVTGAGTVFLRASFVGAPGGQVDEMRDVRLEDGALVYGFFREGRNDTPSLKQTYRVRLEDGKLRGELDAFIGDKPQPRLTFTGVRAPEINERDDASWKPGKPVALFNGKDTGGWIKVVDARPGWVVQDGLLVNEPGASDIVSDQKFWNFILRAEYRYSKGSNSGIGLRGRYEIQIEDSFGKPADSHIQGALYSRITPSSNPARPAGEWQQMEARLVGKTLTVKLNGVEIIHHREIAGPTAITTDANTASPGPITLQGDHGPIEFRKVEVIPLTR
jgi:hypothetical protein